MENKFQNGLQPSQENKKIELEARPLINPPASIMSREMPEKSQNLDKIQIEKTEKLNEYEKMFKILYKQQDYAKIKSLATELKEFDPGNLSAEKWFKKAEAKTSSKGFFAALFSRFKKSKSEQKNSPEKALVLQAISQPNAITQAPATLTPAPKYPTSEAVISKPVSLATPPISLSNVGLPFSNEVKKSQGNTFTKMFGASEKTPKDTSSIIDRIVAKTEKKPVLKTAPSASSLFKPEVKRKEFNLLAFSKLFMNFTAVFIFLTGAFLYVEFIDKDNTFLGLVGIEQNTGGELHAASEKLDETKKQVAILENEIKKYKTGYEDTSFTIIQTIIHQRINWPDIFFKINEVTNSVYELNDFFKYVEYENYSFDAEKQTIRITGHLSDPQGRNLTKLVELEEAFMFYPKDKNNPEDPTKPFFQGFKELTTLSKSIDKETGRYSSDFQLSFSLNPT